jgi:hypothetical protein
MSFGGWFAYADHRYNGVFIDTLRELLAQGFGIGWHGSIGEIIGVVGIGVAATRIGDFAATVRSCTYLGRYQVG